MAKNKYKRFLKIVIGILFTIFILVNIVVIVQAYSLTHFDNSAKPISPNYKPSFVESAKIAVMGLRIPKPVAKRMPTGTYETLTIPVNDNDHLEGWLMHTDSVKQGLVIAFHGYMDEKSSMLDRANVLLKMGYDVLLVDQMGAGGSYGMQTTIGFKEAENVKTAYNYAIEQLHEDKVTLLGFSMGAAAIMKAQQDYDMQLNGIIIEAPYATLKGTVDKRLDKLHMPHFPLSNLFTLWVGVINKFNAFDANPEDYAKSIHVPTLLMCGGKDPNIPRDETETIYNELGSENKELMFFPESVHESYLIKYPKEWTETVSLFLNKIELKDVYTK